MLNFAVLLFPRFFLFCFLFASTEFHFLAINCVLTASVGASSCMADWIALPYVTRYSSELYNISKSYAIARTPPISVETALYIFVQFYAVRWKWVLECYVFNCDWCTQCSRRWWSATAYVIVLAAGNVDRLRLPGNDIWVPEIYAVSVSVWFLP